MIQCKKIKGYTIEINLKNNLDSCFFSYFYFLICTGILTECDTHIYVSGAYSGQKMVLGPRTRIIDGCGCWEPNLGPL